MTSTTPPGPFFCFEEMQPASEIRHEADHTPAQYALVIAQLEDLLKQHERQVDELHRILLLLHENGATGAVFTRPGAFSDRQPECYY